jgi:hypothetical protein
LNKIILLLKKKKKKKKRITSTTTKREKNKQRSTKHTRETNDRVARTPQKNRANSDAPEGSAGPAPLVAPIVLI